MLLNWRARPFAKWKKRRDNHAIPLQYMPGKGRLLPGGLPAVAEVVPAGVGLYPEAGGKGGMPVIFDDIAEIMSSIPARRIRKKTGLSNDKIYRMANGLPFILDYNTLFALQRMGVDIILQKSSHESEHELGIMRVGK